MFAIVSCNKNEVVNQPPIQKILSADFVKTPYTYLQNKYIDLALAYEYKKIGKEIDLEKMEYQEKLDLIYNLFEAKNAKVAFPETKEDVKFYQTMESQLMAEINSHPYIQQFVGRFAAKDFYDENEMIINMGLGDTDVISKFQILYCYEIGFDVYEKYLEREKLIRGEEWDPYMPLPPHPTEIEIGDEEYNGNSPIIQKIVRYMGYALWPRTPKTIKYRLDDQITTNTHNSLKEGMKSWENATNNKIKCEQIANNCTNKFGWSIGCLYHIYVTKSSTAGVSSAKLGYCPWSKMKLSDYAGVGTTRHEFGHILGFQHEHQRPDRDTYINVHLDNVETKYKNQFTKLSSTINKTYGDFDWSSIMIYGSDTFLKSDAAAGSYTMTKKDGSYWLGTSDLSATDKEKIKLIYN